jgi:WD40 repeat protein
MIARGCWLLLGCLLAAAVCWGGGDTPGRTDVPAGPPRQPVRSDRYGDPLPPAAVARLGTVRFRQGQAITALRFTRDGKTLISVGGPEIHVWDAATGRRRRRFRYYPATLYDSAALGVSADGESLATASEDSVRVLRAETGAVIRRFPRIHGRFHSLAFSLDGKVLAGAADKPRPLIQVWRVADGREAGQINQSGGALALAADGKVVAAVSRNALVCWEVATGKEVFRFRDTARLIESLAFAPRGRLIAAALSDASVRLFDIAAAKELRRFAQSPFGSLHWQPLAFSPDGTVLAVGGEEDSVRLWDVASGKPLHRLRGHTHSVRALAFSPDGRRLAAGGEDCTIQLWAVATGKDLHPADGHGDAVRSVVFSTDGRRLFSGSADHTIRVWDPTTGRPLQRFDAHGHGVQSLALSPDGKVLASVGEHNLIRFWDAETGRVRREFRSERPVDSTLAFSPDGTRLAAGVTFGANAAVLVWRTDTMKEVRSSESQEGVIDDVAFSPDGKLVASTSRDNSLHVWDIVSGKDRLRLGGTEAPARCLAFSPDGRTLASGCWNGALRLWDVPSGRQVWRFQGGEDEVFMTVRFSPDGRMVTVAGEEGIIYLRGASASAPSSNRCGRRSRTTSSAGGSGDRRSCRAWSRISGGPTLATAPPRPRTWDSSAPRPSQPSRPCERRCTMPMPMSVYTPQRRWAASTLRIKRAWRSWWRP